MDEIRMQIATQRATWVKSLTAEQKQALMGYFSEIQQSEATQQEIETVFGSADADGNGRLDRVEYVDFVSKIN